MPAIHKLLSNDHEGFIPDEHEASAHPVHTPSIHPGTRNPFLRCPTPPLGPISVDNLDQFELRGLVPQYRVLIGNK